MCVLGRSVGRRRFVPRNAGRVTFYRRGILTSCALKRSSIVRSIRFVNQWGSPNMEKATLLDVPDFLG